MSDITISDSDRHFLFVNVMMLTKAFVELAAHASNLSGDVNDQKDDICKLASIISTHTAKILQYTDDEAVELTKKIYKMKDDFDNLSNLSIDDFLNTDA